MNKDQIQSLIRGLLKAGGGALAAHGITQQGVTSEVTQLAAGVISFVIGQLWSHFAHSDTTPSQPPTLKP